MLSTHKESVQLTQNGKTKLVRVARLGQGAGNAPPVVLLHGYPENLHIWSRVAPLLASNFEVIAFDWPGLGESDLWPGGTTPSHLAGRLLALLDHWRVEQAHLVGFDMGGQPALAFAAEYPSRVDRLVVMNSLVIWDAKTSWEIALLRKLKWNQLILRSLPRLVYFRALQTFLPSGAKLSTEVSADFWVAFKKPATRQFLARMCAGYQADLPRLPELYRQIACPTLILWGEHDKHFPPAHARRLQEIIGGAELRILPRAHHWMPWHAAAEVAAELAAFLKGSP